MSQEEVILDGEITPMVENGASNGTEHSEQAPIIEKASDDIEDDDDDESHGGSVSLPLSRIKKIFKMDPEYWASSETAVFSTAVAAELFVQYFTEQASLMARAEKRKKLQYKDFATAVSSVDQLYFLADTIPKTVPLGELIRENKIEIKDRSVNLEKGQQTLAFGSKTETFNGDEPVVDVDDVEMID